MEGGKTEKILYIQTSGPDRPERLYSPFILGIAAAAMGVEAEIVFMIDGVKVVKKGEAEKIRLEAFPVLAETMRQALDAGVRIYVCEQSTRLLGIPTGDFIEEAKMIGAATLTDLSLEADAVVTF
ncbi:MAG TPA: DsrE family protein [Candidatus Krumholzibacterium sp.]|nr:DsrE family protein [Candidatus Krumholzibacterium sp.]